MFLGEMRGTKVVLHPDSTGQKHRKPCFVGKANPQLPPNLDQSHRDCLMISKMGVIITGRPVKSVLCQEGPFAELERNLDLHPLAYRGCSLKGQWIILQAQRHLLLGGKQSS